MYLDPEYVAYPPADGWPEITTPSMQPFEKTDEVVELLRHLPYVWSAPGRTVHGMLACESITEPPEGSCSKKDQPGFWLMTTQGIWDHVPSHVVGLVVSKDYKMSLDTKLGVIYFNEGSDCIPGPCCNMVVDAPFESIRDEAIDHAPPEEQWRNAGGQAEGCAWAIEDLLRG